MAPLPPLGRGAGGERAVRRNLQEKFRIKKKPEIRNEPKIAAQKIRRVATSYGHLLPRRGEGHAGDASAFVFCHPSNNLKENRRLATLKPLVNYE